LEFFFSLDIGIEGSFEVRHDGLDPFFAAGFSSFSLFLFFGFKGFADSSSGLESFLSSLLAFNHLFSGGFSKGLGERVKSVHGLGVLEGVLLLDFVENNVLSGGSDNGLDFVTVDKSGQISVGHEGSLKVVSFLFNSGFSERSENAVQSVESGSSPDNESTHLSSGGELFKVKSVNVRGFNSRDVSEGLDEFNVFISIDNERSLLKLISFSSGLSISSSVGFSINNFLNIFISTESFKELNGFFGFFIVFEFIINN